VLLVMLLLLLQLCLSQALPSLVVTALEAGLQEEL